MTNTTTSTVTSPVKTTMPAATADPFTTTPSHAHPAPLRYGPLDPDQISMYSTNSPSQAKRALEAHLKDTDRRIQDASRLGTTLLQQRKDLAARLKDVEQVQHDNEVPSELRQKLTELEKEYNEVGKETARAFLPKSRIASGGADPTGTPSVLSAQGAQSPTKALASSRRQRNQPNNRVHDIEFATEISTSLLAQVRQLQAALAEKDDALKDTTASKAQLEADTASMVQRIKQMNESEQRYRDENWNLETRLQELEASFRDSTDKGQRLTQSLKATHSEKEAAQRDLDDLKVSHEKLNEEHAVVKKQQESDLHGLRRDVALHETEKQRMQKKMDELTSQNVELAKAVSYRWNQTGTATDTDFVSADEDQHTDDGTPENSEPASPVKGTPRHGMLESETLKSSLNHAHRMIQNLKNNIHREKTEKIELKRMLQDARDELESRRSEGGVGANMSKKRRSEPEGVKFRKPARPGLGANRSSTTEVLEDEPDWEDQDGQNTPSKSGTVSAALGGAVAGAAGAAVLGDDEIESTDAFETANERDGTTTDAFETSRESAKGNDSDELTEIEDGPRRTGTVRGRGVSPLAGLPAGNRRSFQSTASTSGDEDDDSVRTPVSAQPAKYRLRVNRGSKRGNRVSELVGDSPSNGSPASSSGTPQPASQSLGDELDALDEGSVEGTPSRELLTDSAVATPETQREVSVEPEIPVDSDGDGTEGAHDDGPEIGSPVASPEQSKPEGEEANLAHQANAAMLAHEFAVSKREYADAGVMTEPWEPQKQVETLSKPQGFKERAGEMVGGALAGFGLGRLGRHKQGGEGEDDEATAGANRESTVIDFGADGERPETALAEREVMDEPKSDVTPSAAVKDTPLVAFQQSEIVSQETEPVSPPRSLDVEKAAPLAAAAAAAAEAAAPLAAAGLGEKHAEPKNLALSPVTAQEYEPEALAEEPKSPVTPIVPKRSSKRLDALYESSETTIPGTDGARPGAGFFGAAAAPPLTRNRSQSLPGSRQHGEDGSVPTLMFGDEKGAPVETRAPTGIQNALGDASAGAVLGDGNLSHKTAIPITKPLQIKKPMADEGSQTLVSGEDIESMIRNKSRAIPIGVPAIDGSPSSSRPSTAIGPSGQRRSIDGVAGMETGPARGPRRPASAGSMRNKTTGVPPPLPEDHTQKIAAAQKVPGTPVPAAVGTMGPPLMPASAFKQTRPQTPAERARSMSKDGTTPRPPRSRGSQVQSPSGVSRRTSVSSFASELDERFQINRGQIMYPNDVMPATDPRMIQAITQTMIGEYLWKYTRKAGRSETSTTRHRRFFWVHPYTRTLYWSEKDPSTAGRDMLKAKSVAIEAVRVITDDNTYPPGLHRKSLVVVTPGREIVFTAPTGQRHETWFNALSYLLLRTEQEKNEAEDTVNQEDIDEFNPSFGSNFRRSVSRMTGRSTSRLSLSSYNSRTTRNSTSPQRTQQASGSLAQRQSAAAARAKGPPSPSPNLAATSSSRYSTVRDSSAGGRLSSFTSKFRPPSAQRESFSSRRGRSSMSIQGRTGGDSNIYNASVAADSAEDLRAVIEKQEQDADQLENVRACCDGKFNPLRVSYRMLWLTHFKGKHDVGSLSRTGRLSSFSSRFGSQSHGHSHSHSHGHAHPRAQPIQESQRPRRGET